MAKNPLDLTARLHHWIIAAGIFTMIPLGMYLEGIPRPAPERTPILALHIGLGLSVLVVALWRVARRLRLGWPPLLGNAPAWQRRAAHVVHALLLVFSLLAPIGGLLLALGRGEHIAPFGLFTLSAAGARIPELLAVAKVLHSGPVLVLLLGLVILIHVAAALKRQLIDRDGTLTRMVRGDKAHRA